MAEYTEQVYNIVSRVAYLIGVEERIFKTDEEFVDSENGIRVEDNLLHQVYSELDGINSAKIFRSLNIIRMDIMRNYKEINMQIYYNLKNLDSLPEYVHQDALAFLQENGLVIPEPGKRPYDYTIKLTQLINRRVSEIVLEVFPVWINPDYLKKIFLVKCSSEKDAKLLIQRYNTRHNMYPYQTYLNLDTDCGNVLYIYILVDCENTDVYKLYSMLSAMRQDYPSDVFQKIKKIELYDDVNTTNAWKLLHRFTEIRIEHILSERVKEDKSLVDIRLSAGACKAFYTENIKDFILVSSDSDYFGLFEALSDCRFQVVAERDNLSSYAEEALPEYAYDFCYVDDFCTGKLEPLYVDALKLEINQFLEKKTFVDIKRLFSTAAENLIIASDGKIFLRMENGFYIDRNRNEYRFTAGTLIPVLIRNAQPAYPEITEAEYHDELGKEKAYWDYEVRLENNRYVTIRVTEASGKIETVENEDGLKVYDYDGRYIVNYPYQEKDVLSVVSARYNKKEKGFGQEL